MYACTRLSEEFGMQFTDINVCALSDFILGLMYTDSILPSQNHENIDIFGICTDHLSCVLALVSCFFFAPPVVENILVWSFGLLVSYRYTSCMLPLLQTNTTDSIPPQQNHEIDIFTILHRQRLSYAKLTMMCLFTNKI